MTVLNVLSTALVLVLCATAVSPEELASAPLTLVLGADIRRMHGVRGEQIEAYA